MSHPRHVRSVQALALLSLGLAGCSQGFYKKWADKQVFGIIGGKKEAVAGAGDDTLLSITQPQPVKLDALMKQSETVDFLGKRAFIEDGARVITLANALDFGVHRNRTYLSRKEQVYLSALGLTGTRQLYSPIGDSAGGGTFSERQVKSGVNNWVRTSTLTTNGALGLTYLMKTGARLALDLTTDFQRFFTGNVKSLSDSRAAATLSQPLLRGAGVLAAAEPLRQNERDVLYAIRDFTQYRKGFAVDVTRQYLRTIQAREAARNRFLAYKASLVSIIRDRALAEANLRTQSMLKQIEQGSITYERTWLAAIVTYEDQLDNLKVTLGLPVTERIMPDSSEIKRLEIMHPKEPVEQMVDTAIVTRLDLYNQRERLQDASRKVKIAHQNTLPTVNALTNYEMATPTGHPGLELNPHQRRLSGGLFIDPNLNTLPERNLLRAAQVLEQSTRRTLELQEEQLRATIRTDWRALELARRQYELAQKGLDLAQKRLEIEEALMAEGLGTARDIVESQDRLITARDLIISTIIDHNLVRLQLWTDMGVLFIRKDGTWVDVLESEKVKEDS
jgi:outer membrane protein TolC